MKRAFTMIEMLLVIGILALLLSIVGMRSKEVFKKAAQISCTNNMRQLSLGIQMYAQDDKDGNLSAKVDSEDQDMNWLYRGYVDHRDAYICPNTKNHIRKDQSTNTFTGEKGLTDIMYLSGSRNKTPGMSYQGFGFTGYGVDANQKIRVNGKWKTLNGIRKNLSNIQTYRHYHNSFGLRGVIPGPSQIWILTDQTLPGIWYYPDPEDNHGSKGANIAFCDGHIEWVKREDFIYRYELSQDEGRTNIELTW